jgi:hypothetical protein
MTVGCMFTGLFPIMWSTGTGADVMKRIAAPMVGGIFTSFILELLVYPAICAVWKWNFEVKKQISAGPALRPCGPCAAFRLYLAVSPTAASGEVPQGRRAGLALQFKTSTTSRLPIYESQSTPYYAKLCPTLLSK